MNEIKELDKLYNNMDAEYYYIVKEILEHNEFIKRLNYNHHENRSVFVHSLMVSTLSYKIAKKMKLDYKSAAIGGLLHDFYYEDWQLSKKKGIKNLHGFVHAREAYENSNIHFKNLTNYKVNDIIIKHMFPLNIKPPKYIEGWIVTLFDKLVSLEIFKTPNQLYKYVGLSLIFNGLKIKRW